jgi:hypothetical protein
MKWTCSKKKERNFRLNPVKLRGYAQARNTANARVAMVLTGPTALLAMINQ